MSKQKEVSKKVFPNRQVEDVKQVPGKAKKARKAGPHGSQIHVDGSSQAEPNKHRRVNPGA